MLQPHRTPAPTCPTPGSAYVQEQRLLRAYERLLYAPEVDVETLMQTVWGPGLTPLQMYGRACKEGRIDRLDYQLPDVLRQLLPHEQEPLATFLLADTPDLVAGIRYLLALDAGNGLKQRDTDPRLRLNDDSLAKAAGLGALTQADYHKPLDPTRPRYLKRLALPTPPPAPILRVRRSSRRRRYDPAAAGQLALWP